MLYKYVSVDSLSCRSILKGFKIYFARPKELNDPFEFRPLYTLPSKSKLKRHLIERGAKNRNLKTLVPQAMERLKNNLNIMNDLQDSQPNISGVFCMTPHCDNLLMWAHYADSHKGVCIGFNIDRPFDDDFGVGYEVEYKESLPEICLTEQDMISAAIQRGEWDLERFDEVTTRQCFTKAKAWEYENEVRFHRSNALFGSGTMDFNLKKVTEVILGAKMTTQHKKEVIELVSINFPHADIKEAKLSTSRYELNIDRAVSC